jgi:formylglycine-generating enzyme required for sulfatase activity
VLLLMLGCASETSNGSISPAGDECGDRCVGMVRIPAGSVLLGSPSDEGTIREHPQQLIHLDHTYWIDRYEVTNAQYREFLLQHGNVCVLSGVEYPCHDCFEFAKDDSGLDCDLGFAIKNQCQASPFGSSDQSCSNHPVVNITPAGAAEYCRWLGKSLPSEAEWERAANGPSDSMGEPWRRFPWGSRCPEDFNQTGDALVGDLRVCEADPWSASSALANCDESSCRDGFDATSPVGFFPGGDSPEGVSDLSGNVLERVADCYHDDYSRGGGPPASGLPWTTDCKLSFTIARGSGFGDPGAALRSRARTDEVAADSADPDVGFRCVVRISRRG